MQEVPEVSVDLILAYRYGRYLFYNVRFIFFTDNLLFKKKWMMKS